MEEQTPALSVFCGYAHQDKVIFEQLNTALAVLIRQNTMSVWHDGDLQPGAQWELKLSGS